ncbi:MAG: YceI family protein [Gemmatimonadales bacterium]
MIMHRRWTLLGWAFGTMAVAIPAVAQAIPDAPLAHGTLSFDANATLGAFTGVTRTLTGQLTGAARIDGIRGWVEAPTKSLTTNNGHRDRDMAGSLDIAKYPTMRFDLDSLTPGDTHGDSTAVTLHGRFTVHGQTHDANVPGWAWVRPSGERFRGAVSLNVKDYGVGGLSKMLGILKMDKKIAVRMDVTFER